MWDLIVSVPDHCLSFYFSVKSLQRLHAVIWCICRVPVTLETDRYNSAVLDVAISASTIVPVQPLD